MSKGPLRILLKLSQEAILAIYYFDASVISGSKGRSATAAAAYRTAEVITDHRSGEVHDYTRKGGVLHTEIIAPDNAPAWLTKS